MILVTGGNAFTAEEWNMLRYLAANGERLMCEEQGFTAAEYRRLLFVRWLYLSGRISS